MSFQKIFIAFTLTGLFALAMISFGVQIASENDSDNSILDDPSISKVNASLFRNLTTYQSMSQGQRENFESEIPTTGFGTLIIFGVMSAGKVFTGMVMGVFSSLLAIFSSERIGIDPVVLGILTSLLIFGTIFALWRLYKAGE